MKDTFLKIEDRARKYFERFPFIQAFMAGIGVILFWRGIWEVSDMYGLDPRLSIILGVLILGSVGLFVQTFVGNAIIIKNVKREIDLDKESRKEFSVFEKNISQEEITLAHLSEKLDKLADKVDHLEKHLE